MGEQQDQACEQVRQRLLSSDAEHHTNYGSADEEFLDINPRDCRRERKDGKDTDQRQHVPKYPGVRLPDPQSGGRLHPG
jgi:hypothetical protein